MKDWLYVGIFLVELSKNTLKEHYPIPKGWKKYYDHMTVVYNDGSQFAKNVKFINERHFCKRLTLRVIAVGISEKAMAVKVELPQGVVCANKIPHITLGVSPDGKPVDSNDITNWNTIHTPFYLTGIMMPYLQT